MPKVVAEKDKAETRTVSLPKSLWEKIDAHVQATNSDRSAAVKTAVTAMIDAPENDPSSGPINDIIVRVARAVAPGYADDLAQECKRLAVDQPKLMAQIMAELFINLDELGREGGWDAKPLVTGRGRLVFELLPADASAYHLSMRHVEALKVAEDGPSSNLPPYAQQVEVPVPPPPKKQADQPKQKKA